MIVEGQIHGGVAQGVGGALYEKIEYDENGQILNASFMDFLMPYATEVPEIETDHLETPSPLNPLGIKGAGEAGVIPGMAVFAAAIEDAEGFPIRDADLAVASCSSCARRHREADGVAGGVSGAALARGRQMRCRGLSGVSSRTASCGALTFGASCSLIAAAAACACTAGVVEGDPRHAAAAGANGPARWTALRVVLSRRTPPRRRS